MRDSSGHQESNSGTQRPTGIIDTLGLSFATLNQRPYLIWIPVAVDMLHWSGIRIRVDDLAGWLPGEVLERLARVDLIAIQSLFVPTLIDVYGHERVASPPIGSTPQMIENMLGVLALVVAAALAFLIAIVYLTVIGRLVDNRPAWGRRFIIDCLQTAGRGLLLVMTATALFGFMALPVAAVGFALSWLGANPAIVVLLGAGFLLFWLGMHFLFGIPALAMGQQSITGALRSSYQVVHQNFLGVLGLLIVALLIRTGVPYALQVFVDSEWSVPFAIVAHAYIATGLITALLLFFRTHANELETAHIDSHSRVSGT